jgi:hypothetical protein
MMDLTFTIEDVLQRESEKAKTKAQQPVVSTSASAQWSRDWKKKVLDTDM